MSVVKNEKMGVWAEWTRNTKQQYVSGPPAALLKGEMVRIGGMGQVQSADCFWIACGGGQSKNVDQTWEGGGLKMELLDRGFSGFREELRRPDDLILSRQLWKSSALTVVSCRPVPHSPRRQDARPKTLSSTPHLPPY